MTTEEQPLTVEEARRQRARWREEPEPEEPNVVPADEASVADFIEQRRQARP